MRLTDREKAIVLAALRAQEKRGSMVIRFVAHPAYPPQTRTIDPEEIVEVWDKVCHQA